MLSKFNRLLPTVGKLVKQSRNAFATAGAGKDLSSRNTQTGVTKRDRLQFGKERLTDFGDLPAGEIPEALKYDLPVETSQLNNGVRVATMQWPGQLATITVHIKAGSRQETIENSGVSHFLQNLNLRGTKNRTRNQLEGELADIAGQIVANTTRETTTYTITVAKNDVAKAVNILGDILTNSTYDKNQVEAERETVYREIIGLQKDQLESTIEASHYTSFRDHMLGQPRLGIRENIASITQEQIVEYQKANYYGSNIVVTGAGDVSHQQLTELAEKALGGLAGSAPSGLAPKNSEQAYFTPSLMYMRDDEMANINIGIFFQAPSYTHEDYFSFLLYQRILGEYRESKNTGGHLNHSERQYNTLHSLLGSLPDITLQKTLYFPYSDTGLFGSWVHGNEVHAFQMLYVSQLVLSDYANYLNQVEVFRGKNKLYNDLLQSETGLEVTQNLGNQLLYLNRVVPRSEIAKRISSIEQPHLSRVARHWFFDTEISAVAWGPIHALMTLAHYNRPIRRSTLGWYGDAAYHIH